MNIVILGNGISGITAARHIRKLSDHDITVVSSETEYFFSRTAIMYIYMGHMRLEDTQPYENWFWEKNNIRLKKAHVDKLEVSTRSLICNDGSRINYDKLILAVGSKTNKYGWPGQDLDGVEGLYSLQDLEYMEAYSEGLERAVIVGGGLIGIEMAEMFLTRNIPVTMLVRESSYWNNVLTPEESAMVNRQARSHGVDLRLSTELERIVDNGSGKVDHVITKDGERIDCGYVGITAGVSPNVEFLKNTELKIDQGILVNDYLETNIEGIYAAGDCAEIIEPRKGRKPIEAIWYAGRIMGEVVAYNVVGQPVKYDPGVWFNSAKFFDIEYQVYGQVPPEIEDPLDSIHWEDEEGMRSVRLVFDKNDLTIQGFNLMGIRFRHEVCEKWIEDKASLETVIENLKMAYFDPEFYNTDYDGIARKYSERFNKDINPRKQNLNQILSFLNS